MKDIVIGKIVDETQAGMVIIHAPVPADLDEWGRQNPSKCFVKYVDGRKASPEQIKKIHAMIGEISEWLGDYPEQVKLNLKRMFILNKLDSMESEMFSFSDCGVEKARLFISFLIDLMIQYGVPSRVPLYEQAEDIHAYVYACLMNKTCAVCGQKGVDLHHVVPLGMGADRESKPQLGYPVLPLCRKHHNEMHTDSKRFLEAHHIEPIKLTDEIARVYGFSKKARRESEAFNENKH